MLVFDIEFSEINIIVYCFYYYYWWLLPLFLRFCVQCNPILPLLIVPFSIADTV